MSDAATNARTRALLRAPVVPLLLRLAWPNMLVMLAQASSGLVETWWISRLGTDALAGMALVFPCVALMQMLSAGALGGSLSSAVARALGRGDEGEANALVWHGLVINAVLGSACAAVVLLCGPALYRALGGRGASLDAALRYSNVVFAGNVLLWVMNALAGAVRGTGDMLTPASVTCVGVVLLVPLSPCLIFGWGPFPALGIAGGGAALLLFYAGGTAVLLWHLATGRGLIRLRRTRLRWGPFRDILRIGAAAAVSTVQTNLVVALTTALVGAWFGPDAVAGYGTAARLEYLLVPLVFGLGAPLIAAVGTNIGAGQGQRALRVAFAGAVIGFTLCEGIGLMAAAFPDRWLTLFGNDVRMLTAGRSYLRAVGPLYGCYGGGLALYFALQGAGRLLWPLLAGLLRLLVAVGGGWLALRAGLGAGGLFAALGAGLLCFGGSIALIVRHSRWTGASDCGRAPGASAPSLRAGGPTPS